MVLHLWAACTRGGHAGRTVTVKVRYADLQQITRSRSDADPVATQTRLGQVSLDLLRPLFPPRQGMRLLGVWSGPHFDRTRGATVRA